MDNDDDNCTPPDILELATKVTHNLLPEKSRKAYDKEYNNFLAWKIDKKTTSFSENIILAYLKVLSDKFKPSSMWAKYSMLKSTLNIYNNIDITKYSKVIAFLKRSSEGHKEKKSLTFTSGQVKMFLENSPDILYLFEKVFVTAVGLTSADVSLGYNYKPHSHGSGSGSYVPPFYGVPSQSYASNAGLYTTAYNGVNRLNYKGPGQIGQQPSSIYPNINKFQGNRGSSNENVYQSGADHQGGNNFHPLSLLSGNYHNNLGSTVNNVPANVGNNGFQSFNQFHHSNQYQHKYQDGYQVQHQPPLIFKHFYVHAAPDEEEPPKPRHPIVLPPPQKHYKIIFIKTPAQPISSPNIIPVVQPNEEKTIIYVLVKKPEEIRDIVIPKVEQRPPAKPEVFFIKYNNKEGSQTVIDNIVNDYNKAESVNVPGTGISESSSSISENNSNQGTITPNTGNESSGETNNIPSGFGSQSFLGSDSFGAAFGSSSSEGMSSTPSLVPSGFVSHPLTISTATAAGGISSATAITSNGSGASTSGSVFESSASALPATDNVTPISTSQGVPHETYGPPKFRE